MGRPARRLDAGVVLGAPRRARALPGRRAAAARLPRLPPLGVRVGRARPGAEAGRSSRPARRSAASTADVTFVSSTRATELDDWLALYPDLRFKLDPTPEWTDELIATLAGRGNVDVVDLKGAVQGDGRRQPRRRRALPACRGGLPERVDRGPGPDARDRRRARAAPRPDHVGRADPLVGRRRGAAVRAAVPERRSRRASERSRGCSSSTSAASRRASSSTAAGSSSSASAAARSRSSQRCSPRTARTTWRPAATTRPSRRRASRRRSGRCPSATASARVPGDAVLRGAIRACVRAAVASDELSLAL